MKYTAIFLFCIFFFSCTPQQRLNRLKSEHPELFTKDTIRIHDTGSVVLQPTDIAALNQLDSLLDALMDCGEDTAKEGLVTSQLHKNTLNNSNLQNNSAFKSHKQHIKEQIKDLYIDKPCIAPGDTLKHTVKEKGIVFRIWQEGNRLKFDHYNLVVTDKANIVETKTSMWKNYLIAGLTAISILMLLLLLIRR